MFCFQVLACASLDHLVPLTYSGVLYPCHPVIEFLFSEYGIFDFIVLVQGCLGCLGPSVHKNIISDDVYRGSHLQNIVRKLWCHCKVCMHSKVGRTGSF